ncbi:MAG: response regulator transcription factor [Desulfobacterales bacterium]
MIIKSPGRIKSPAGKSGPPAGCRRSRKRPSGGAAGPDLEPDVIVADINMPELNGIEATRQISGGASGHKNHCPSMYSTSDMWWACSKPAYPASLKIGAFDESAVAVSDENQNLHEPENRGHGDERLRQYSESSDMPPASKLTVREREVLQLIAEGLKTKDIAARIHVSVKTVETHRQQIM